MIAHHFVVFHRETCILQKFPKLISNLFFVYKKKGDITLKYVYFPSYSYDLL